MKSQYFQSNPAYLNPNLGTVPPPLAKFRTDLTSQVPITTFPQSSHTVLLMTGDDYSAAISGGLKLKGSKPSGVTKKKKKEKKNKDDSTATALQNALADEEQAAAAEKTHAEEQQAEAADEEDYEPGSSKTEAERKYEEMRRKRVRPFTSLHILSPPLDFPSHSHHIASHHITSNMPRDEC